VTLLTDTDLYLRGAETLVASWDAIARGSRGAAVLRSRGVAAAVFPHAPERAVYNNALLERDLGSRELLDAVDLMEAAYASARVDRFAAWVHDSDEAMRAELGARGYTLDTSTRAMGIALGDVRLPRPAIELAPADWSDYIRYLEALNLPPGLLGGVDPTAFHVLVARLEGQAVATGLAFDFGDDSGIYNISTVEPARRRGLGTALTVRLVHDAAARGCCTASLQSTEMAERVYAAVGFRDLGRFMEYVPRHSTRRGAAPQRGPARVRGWAGGAR
jgi:GNAT superfamily N-acetyltransferase